MEIVDYVLGDGVMGAVTPVVDAMYDMLPSKTLLDVKLSNPVILVPCGAMSEDLLHADGGDISVMNEFVAVDDGTFWISFKDFVRCFGKFSVCKRSMPLEYGDDD